MTVKVWLEGHQFDLEALAELLTTGDIRVETDGDGGFYLTADEIDNRLVLQRQIVMIALACLPWARSVRV